MSKERLEEIKRLQDKYYSTWDNDTSLKYANDLMKLHSDWIIKQIEDKQIEQMNLIIDKADERQQKHEYIKTIHLINEQNKGYREKIEKSIKQLTDYNYWGEVRESMALDTLKEALEGEPHESN